MTSTITTARRAIRQRPIVEWAVQKLKGGGDIDFPEANLTVRAGPGDIIIDAGANVGVITSRCARTGATVYAFEPSEWAYQKLKQRFRLTPNVHPINKGVLDRACRLALSTKAAHDRYDRYDVSLVSSFTPTFDASGEETVECVDLAAFVARHGPVKLLKIDVEGAEIAVVNHLIDTRAVEQIELMLVETHERLSPELAEQTAALRERVACEGLARKVNMDWFEPANAASEPRLDR